MHDDVFKSKQFFPSAFYSQLKEEEEDIEKKIREYAALTNFTRLQLLYLRNRLSSFKDDESPSYYYETLILLQAINPQVLYAHSHKIFPFL